MVTPVNSSARWFNPAQFIANTTNEVIYRTDQRKVESDLIEKLIFLTFTPDSYSEKAKEDLKNQLSPETPETISAQDQFDGFHSIEIACLAKIAKEKITGNKSPRQGFLQLIETMKAAEGKAGATKVNIFEGAGYSELSAADKIFNSKLVRQLAQWMPDPLGIGNLLQLRCFEATVSLVAIALRNLVTIMSDVTPGSASLTLEQQKQEVESFIKKRLPNGNEQSLSPKEQDDLNRLLETLFKPAPQNNQNNNRVDLTLSPTLADLQRDLEKIDPQKQNVATVNIGQASTNVA